MSGLYGDARRYDLIYVGFTEDICFYTDLAASLGVGVGAGGESGGAGTGGESGGAAICDLACGTGRVTIPLARHTPGATVYGVDNALEQLRLAEKRARREGVENLRWVHREMEAVELPGRCDLAVCALHSLEHLTEEARLDRFFRNLRERVLRPGGTFAFALHLPDPAYLTGAGEGVERVGEYGEGKERFALYEQRSYDSATQILSLSWFFEPYRGEVSSAEYELRLFYPREMRRILSDHGFEVQGVYGWYDRRPLQGDAGSQVIVATAPAG